MDFQSSLLHGLHGVSLRFVYLWGNRMWAPALEIYACYYALSLTALLRHVRAT